MLIATQLRSGMVINHKDELCRITYIDHVTPGKGRGMIHAKMVKILKGTQVEYRFRSGEKTEPVRLEQKEMEYLYNDGTGYVFMDTNTYDQITLMEDIVGGSVQFLVPNTKCEVDFHETTPISVTLPLVIELKITETEPKLKGATASASMKPATLETGAIIQIPQFIETGEVVRVDTATGKYIERAK